MGWGEIQGFGGGFLFGVTWCCVICAVLDGVCVRGTICPGVHPAEGSHDPTLQL